MSLPLPPPPLGHLVELCIVTPDIHATIDSLTPLGFGPFTIHTFDDASVECMEYKGSPTSFSLRVAFATHTPPSTCNPSGVTVELMQPLSGPSLMADFLGRNGGRAGVQHVAFDMPQKSMDERVRAMGKKGVGVAMRGVWRGERGRCEFCFFDTEGGLGGMCVETIVWSEDWVDPRGEVYPALEG